MIFDGFPWYSQLWIIADIAIALFTAFRLFQVGFYLIFSNILTAVVIVGQVNDALKESSLKMTPYPAEFTSTKVISVQHFLVQHNYSCALVLSGNRLLWGSMLAAVLLTNLPMNIYVQSRLVLFSSKAVFVEQLLNILILFIHSVGFYQCLLPLVYTAKKLHAPQKAVATLQYHLRGKRFTLLKLKLDDLRGRLGDGPKVAFTLAPGKQITDQVILEVKECCSN